MTGADTHWTATAVREEFLGEFSARVRELADNDPEFRAEHADLVARSEGAHRP